MTKTKKSFWHIGIIYDDVDPRDQWWPALLWASLACFVGGMYLYHVAEDWRKNAVFEWIACAIAVFMIAGGIHEFVVRLLASIDARKNAQSGTPADASEPRR